MVDLATGLARRPLKTRGDDLYETPESATRALLRCEALPTRIWEPACGRGAIARLLRDKGHEVMSTDLVDYGWQGQDASRMDFLFERKAPAGFDCIVTNPPYKNAEAFVRQAVRLCPKVVMLLRLAFLEGEGRSGIIDSHLARVHVFRKRIPGMYQDSYTGKRGNSAMAFAWFVWERDHCGPISVDRI